MVTEQIFVEGNLDKIRATAEMRAVTEEGIAEADPDRIVAIAGVELIRGSLIAVGLGVVVVATIGMPGAGLSLRGMDRGQVIVITEMVGISEEGEEAVEAEVEEAIRATTRVPETATAGTMQVEGNPLVEDKVREITLVKGVVIQLNPGVEDKVLKVTLIKEVIIEHNPTSVIQFRILNLLKILKTKDNQLYKICLQFNKC